VTVAIAAWVALKHFALHLESQPAQIADVIIFNVTAICGLTLGIRAKRALNGGRLRFGDGLFTGMSIAVTYAILDLCLLRDPRVDRWSEDVATGRRDKPV
jgi:uncharacterized membrane protein